MDEYIETPFSSLVGKTIARIEGMKKNSERIVIDTADGDHYVMYHVQDCCESVSVDDVIGDPADLIGSPILMADEAVNPPAATCPPANSSDESHTWTFYRLATVRGYVTIRWYGGSNGYHSERVDFVKIAPAKEPA